MPYATDRGEDEMPRQQVRDAHRLTLHLPLAARRRHIRPRRNGGAL